MKNLKTLVSRIRIKDIVGSTDKEISSLQYDSRKCGMGSLFVAMKGSTVDGHNYIKDVIKQGAIAIVCEENIISAQDAAGVTMIIVDNSRSALAELSHAWYDYPTRNIRVIGITGTNGKTTITFLLKSIMERMGQKTGIIGTTGIFIGDEKIPATHTTPESLELCGHFDLMREKNVENIIMEVSSHALDQHRADCIDFKAAIFTNLTHEHLDYHKTMKEYARAKKRLFDMLENDGIAIVTDESEFSEYLLSDCKAKTQLSVGRSVSADIRIDNEQMKIDSTCFDLIFEKDKKVSFKTNLLGRFNIDNSAFTAAVCRYLGISDDKIQEGLSATSGAPGRMQRIKLKSGAIAIVDYAHTPDALDKAISACRDVLISSGNSNNQIITVVGCGGDRDKSKRPIMGSIATKNSNNVIITNDNPRTESPEAIIDEIVAGISTNNFEIIADREEAIKRSVSLAQPNDIILVAGKGHENYQIIGTTKHHFDDVEELMKFA
jgi:UDP-N-acetylmuramoyl-L-alanyl-D-glutamate--2,6-diaminopimelate ligase